MASLPARDLMDEYFDSPALKAALSWDGLIGSKMAPRSPNSAVLMLLYRLSEQAAGSPSYGVGALQEALLGAAKAAGVTVRCASPVERIVIDTAPNGLVASGVEIHGGERLAADRVIASTDPKRTFFDLVGARYLDIGFTNRIRRLRTDGFVGKLHLALDGTPEFSGLEVPAGRLILADDMDSIEFAYDAAKFGSLPARPVLEVTVPSLVESGLAPDGQHVLSAHVLYMPAKLKGGWNDDARATATEGALDVIADHAPSIRKRILAAEFLSPVDIETEYAVTGGHWHHAEFAMDQMLMMRPTYGAAQYATPIPGLHLCGAGCHPAGDLTGLAGHNAAAEILK